jgi:hypothetical protein
VAHVVAARIFGGQRAEPLQLQLQLELRMSRETPGELHYRFSRCSSAIGETSNIVLDSGSIVQSLSII